MLYSKIVISNNLDFVINGDVLSEHVDLIDNVKLNQIKELALTFGVFYGRNSLIEEINQTLDKNESYLNEINFAPLLIGANLLPPVVVEANNTYEYEDDTHYHEINKMYRIIQDARVVYEVPSWYSYIHIATDKNKPVSPVDFKLENKQEKDIWKQNVKKGIALGKLQALDEFDYQLSLMIRDYKGMLLAHHLNDLGIINFSKLQVVNNGIIVNDKEININDKLISSNQKDIFNHVDNWIPLIKKATSLNYNINTDEKPFIKKVSHE